MNRNGQTNYIRELTKSILKYSFHKPTAFYDGGKENPKSVQEKNNLLKSFRVYLILLVTKTIYALIQKLKNNIELN